MQILVGWSYDVIYFFFILWTSRIRLNAKLWWWNLRKFSYRKRRIWSKLDFYSKNKRSYQKVRKFLQKSNFFEKKIAEDRISIGFMPIENWRRVKLTERCQKLSIRLERSHMRESCKLGTLEGSCNPRKQTSTKRNLTLPPF